LALIRESIQEDFKDFLADKELIVQGVLYLKEVILSVGYREKGGIRQRNFEASLDFDLNTQNPMDLIHAALDSIGAMMSQWIEADGDINVPLSWTKFTIDNKDIWLCSTNINSDIEAQADAILGEEFLKREAEITEETVDELFAQIRSGALSAEDIAH
jgi:hypothetical protein